MFQALLEWARSDTQAAIALGTIALAVLTFVLILVTFFYALTSWTSLRILRKEFEYRICPIVEVTVSRPTENEKVIPVLVDVKSKNAPARLIRGSGKYFVKPGFAGEVSGTRSSFDLEVEGEVVPTDQTRQFGWYVIGHKFQELSIEVTLEYEDLAGLKHYKATAFEGTGFGAALRKVLNKPKGFRLDEQRSQWFLRWFPLTAMALNWIHEQGTQLLASFRR